MTEIAEAWMSESAFATFLGVTARRIRQQTAEGLIVREGNRIDALGSMKLLLEHARRDESTRRARQRLLEIQAHSRLQNIQLADKQMFTVDEVREVFGKAFERLWLVCQFFGSRAFYAAQVHIGEDKARALAFELDGYTKTEALAVRKHFEDLVGKLQSHAQLKTRLESISDARQHEIAPADDERTDA